MSAPNVALRRSLITKRTKLEKQKAQAEHDHLIANADAEMDRRFTAEDLGIERIVDQARAEIKLINARMDAAFDALGVAKELRGKYRLSYTPNYYRADKDQRSELRRKVRVEADAWLKQRLAEIDAWEFKALAALVTESMTEAEAEEVMASLPDVTDALPRVAGIIGPVEAQPLAVIESSRDAKRLAVLGALSTDSSRSDRQIGRLLGIDHKTVSKVRAEAGEIPAHGGESFAPGGEIPTVNDEPRRA